MSNQIPDPKKHKTSDGLTKISSKLDEFLTQFEPWVETRRVVQLRGGRFFDYCVRSSLAKLFDFGRGMISLEASRDQIPAYFVSGSLRGICEDVIILCYLLEIPNNRRDQLLTKWFVYDAHRNLSSQEKFFSNYRPTQNVPTLGKDVDLDKIADDLRNAWVELGWNLRNKQTRPSTGAIAKKVGILDLYDFFYRYTSNLVHFNPGVLLRFGWGYDLKSRFSVSNFNKYYLHFGLVYGAYFWCLTLQLLRKSHRLPKELRSVEKEMVEWLFRIVRWPEMVTREELNMPPSKTRFMDILMHRMLVKPPSRLIKRKRKK